MLAELSIRNFAIIDEITVPFEEGLTVLTGETGAGKSIIIDAIGLLIGGRGSSEFVRHGTKRAEIEGLFQLEDHHHIYQKAEDIGIEVKDSMMILRRDITSTGKSVCRINGKLVTLATLREFGHSLVDIHGQHEHQFLLQGDKHLSYLDHYSSDKIIKSKQEYFQLYTKFQDLQKRLKRFNENEQEIAQRLDLLQYQIREINDAKLQPGEDEQLEGERAKFANYEKLFQSASDAYHSLYGEQRGVDIIGLAMSHLEDISEMDEKIKSLYEAISNAFYLIEDSAHQLRDYIEQMEYDPVRLNMIEERLNEIDKLKRKYGSSVSTILEYAASIEDETDELQNREDRIDKLQKEINDIISNLYIEAKNLTKIRKKSAKKLEKAIHEQLNDLYMAKTKFSVNIKQLEGTTDDPIIDGKRVKFSKDGIETCEFYISTNPGEPLKPLSKVASGGELSRIILAIKAILKRNHSISSIIFDEVDTGVSGRVAQAIAEKIHNLSVGSQVLCITHLPQVAAMADNHLYITKSQTKDRTKTNVMPLTGEDKIKEIGRMISGTELTDITKQHAKEMLDIADKIKLTS